MNKYRVEWDPPSPGKMDGYVRWYLNDNFIFGINGQSLNITGTTIPTEPMYLIMNTAVASSWGFPLPCPEGCNCKCFECGNPDCGCSLPSGYCENFPANFEIDYVRVWQAKNEPKHQLGCSTKDRPSELFIKGHKERYTENGQKEPLQPVRIGGATCSSDLECGGIDHGSCGSNGSCICVQGFAGSSCLSHFGFDDDPYTENANTLEGMFYFSINILFSFEILAHHFSFTMITHSILVPVSSLLLPNQFLIIFSMFLLGLCVYIALTVYRRHRESEAAAEMSNLADSPVYNANRQYNSVDTSNQQNPVSYCLIDGRMVDN